MLTTEMGAGCQRDVVTQTGSISVLMSCALVGGKPHVDLEVGRRGGGEGDLDNLGTTKVCLALHQQMELLGCYINFIKNQIFFF